MSGAPIEIRELVGLLSGQARSVCRELFPQGRDHGHHVTVGSIAGEPGQSLSVYLRGAKPGNWRDFGAPENAPEGRGDILDLVAQVLFQGSKRDAVRWSLRFLGLSDASPDQLRIRRREAEARARQAEKEEEARRARYRGRAWRIWQAEATPLIAGTPVDAYLRCRGIDIRRLKSHGALRFHSDLLVSETGELRPGLVAAIVGPDGRFMACHRTFLEERGGVWGKAAIEKPKRVLGACLGGHISLAKGPSGKPLRHAPEGDAAILTEGIENGLTMALACPEMRVVATISLGNMASIVMPPAITTRILVNENDATPAARAAFDRAVSAHYAAGAAVRVARLAGGDPNDVLRGAA